MLMKKAGLLAEMIILFGLVPFSLALPVPVPVKIGVVAIALGYCVYVSKILGLFNRKHLLTLPTSFNFRVILLRFLLFACLSTLAMAIFYPERFFYVVINKPLLWVGISLFYAIFSVYPQEFLYRVLFFKRYRSLLKSTPAFILLNAIVFSFAHVMFSSTLVYILTFFGGILFALTYLKSKSLMIVSIEHSAYGLWLYTLGIGNMLAFPG